MPTQPQRLFGRDAALSAVDAALDAGPPALLLADGPPGSGVSALLDAAAARAEARGLRVQRWPEAASAPDLVCVDGELDAATLRALPPAVVLLAAAAPGGTRLPLPPLDRAALVALVGAEHADACLTLSGGNPRLVAHLTPFPPDPDVVLEAVAADWEDALAPPLRRLAEAAGVFDAPTPLWVAAEVAGLGREDGARAADALVSLGLLAAADPVTAAQPLALRALAAAATGAGPDERRRRAAQLLARTGEGLGAAAELLLALPPGGEDWAAVLLRRAAAVATDAGEHGAAVARLERALAEPLPEVLRAELLLELGDARTNAGIDGAIEAYQQALRLVPPAVRPRVHLLLGRARFGAGDYRGAALELDRGLDAEPDDELRNELLAAYIAATRFDRTLEDGAARYLGPVLEGTAAGRTVAERALFAEIALEQGIRGTSREVVVSLAMRAWADGLLLEGADPWGITVSQVAAALTWSDAFAESVHVLTATVERSDRHGEELLGATAHYLRAWPQWYLGSLAEAEADARAALDAEGWRMYEASARAILGHVLIDRGDNAAARDALVLSDLGPWERTVPYAMLLETRSRLDVSAGRLEDAASALEEAGELLATMGNQSPFCPWRSRLGVVRARLGEPERGLELIAFELEQAQRLALPRATGVALMAHGLVLSLRGGGAEELAAAAVELERAGARVEQARALANLGRVLAAGGRRVDARAPLREAFALASRSGALDVAARAERELRGAGGRPSRPSPGGLTASELRVARLAAEGRTNREIADELVVTVHTVRFHLSGIYRKLGVASRTELTAALDEGIPARS